MDFKKKAKRVESKRKGQNQGCGNCIWLESTLKYLPLYICLSIYLGQLVLSGNSLLCISSMPQAS